MVTYRCFATEKRRLGGGYTEVVPPVPISNTEVKYLKADDSVSVEERESR